MKHPLLLICMLCAPVVQTHAQTAPDARFRSLDKNGDGRISREEVMGTVAEKIFDRIDKNKDGFLTPDEVPRGKGARNGAGESASPASIVTQMDIRYAEVPPGVDANLLSLDVYAPKDAKNLPVMIYIHGGGWHTGDKSSAGAKPAYFTARGFVFVSLNYRLVPGVDILTQLQDSANAIGWIHKHIAELAATPRNCISSATRRGRIMSPSSPPTNAS